jgi:hypothetical protein
VLREQRVRLRQRPGLVPQPVQSLVLRRRDEVRVILLTHGGRR